MRLRSQALVAALLALAAFPLSASAPFTLAGTPYPASGDSSSYAQALAPVPLQFPRDQGPHPDFRQEWWYLTGNLGSTQGERFGFELTIFRFALAPDDAKSDKVGTASSTTSAWRSRQIYLGHFAVTDVARRRFRFVTKLSRGALQLAGAQADPLRVWIHDWQIAQEIGRAHV